MKIQIDKMLHFLMNFFIVAVVSIFNVWIGIAVACLASLGKELYDMKQEGNHFCWYDLLADGLGIVVSVITVLLLQM